MSQIVSVFAGAERRAQAWLDERDVPADRVRLIVHADQLDHRSVGLAFDLTGFIFASGPLRRAMEARRDRFDWLTEAEFLAEVRS